MLYSFTTGSVTYDHLDLRLLCRRSQKFTAMAHPLDGIIKLRLHNTDKVSISQRRVNASLHCSWFCIYYACFVCKLFNFIYYYILKVKYLHLVQKHCFGFSPTSSNNEDE